jgi:replicative DNA helicase
MIADLCNIGCDEIYNEMFGWIKNGTAEPVLYIVVEQDLEEVQTMMLAFLSAVNEEHILNNKYVGDEEERVQHAIEILQRSKILIIELPDFSLRDVENLIKKHIRENDIKYVIFDYIMTSLKILEEIAGRTGGVRLREDNILFMLSRRLKDIANEYGVFVLSATQLSADWRDSETPDQNLLRGAKSIADSIDLGMHILPVTQKDLEGLETILSANTFERPNTKISVYKNRRGRYKGVYLWCKADLGICRVNPMFATTWDYEIINIEDLKIITEDPGAFGEE